MITIQQLKEDLGQLKTFLSELPEETSRAYELSLTKLVESIDNNKLKPELVNIIDTETNETIKYNAFYSLCILYRRNKDITLYENLLKSHPAFESHPTFNHQYVLYLMSKGVYRNAEDIIQKAYNSSITLSHNAGVVHNFADIVISIHEESDSNMKEYIEKEWIDKAITAVNKAIEMDRNYAKYYCTKGRLLSTIGKYEDAKDNIKHAIDIEESSKTDYVIRLGNYQYYLLLVQSNNSMNTISSHINKNIEIINTTTENIDKKLSESNIKNLEFLGFFTALLSFTIGSIQILNNQSFDNAIKLIITLMGCILCVFSCFGIILHGINKKSIPGIIIFLIGIIIILIVLLI